MRLMDVKRRKLLRNIFGLAVVGSTSTLLCGCFGKKKVTEAPPPPPPAPVETPEPSPSEEIVADTSPSPEESPTPDAIESEPEEPPAPYGQLTENQQQRVNTIMEALADVNADEAKRWADNLAYDAKGTEHEIRAWEAIADAYRRFNESHPEVNDTTKQEAFGAILMRSLLPEGEALRYVHLSALTKDEAKEVMALYTPPGITPSPSPSAEI